MLPCCLLGSSTEQMHDNLESLFYMIKKQNVVKGYVISAAVLQQIISKSHVQFRLSYNFMEIRVL